VFTIIGTFTLSKQISVAIVPPLPEPPKAVISTFSIPSISEKVHVSKSSMAFEI
jgi:hypothetical protein